MILSFVSFGSSIVSIFVMYYVLAGVALVTGLISMRDENAKKMSVASIVIVCITLVAKLLTMALQNGELPAWLTSGIA